MLVCLQRDVQHLTSLIALLIHQLVTYGQQPGETGLDDFVEVGAVVAIADLEPIGSADCQQALEASQDRRRIIGV